MEDDLIFFFFVKMEDDLNIFENGRQPHFFLKKWMMTYIFWKWKTTSIFLKMEDDLKKNDATLKISN